MPNGDASIVQRVLAGDREAYSELVRLHQRRLRSVLSYYCRSSDEVEEYLQEAFVQAYAGLRQYDATAPFFPWLKTIALNALRMEARRHETRRATPVDYLKRLQLQQVGPDDLAEARGSALRDCLKKLPPAQSDLLAARYRDGRPLQELAGNLRISLSALKVRLLRLREALRDCIQRHFAVERS